MTHGLHVIVDAWGVSVPEDIEPILREAARRSGNAPLEFVKHDFKPQGMPAALILAESHITIHTWPEHDYAAIDCFTCGKTNPGAAIDYILEKIKGRGVIKTIVRGEDTEAKLYG